MRRAHPAPRATRRRCTALLTLATLGLAGCGGSSSPDKEIDSVSSWTSTVALARAARRRDRAPVLYTTELRDEARSALDASRQSFAAESLSRADRRRADAALDSLQGALAQLDHELNAP